MLNPICAINFEGQEPGEGGRDDICDHGLLSRSRKVEVCEKIEQGVHSFAQRFLTSQSSVELATSTTTLLACLFQN